MVHEGRYDLLSDIEKVSQTGSLLLQENIASYKDLLSLWNRLMTFTLSFIQKKISYFRRHFLMNLSDISAALAQWNFTI